MIHAARKSRNWWAIQDHQLAARFFICAVTLFSKSIALGLGAGSALPEVRFNVDVVEIENSDDLSHVRGEMRIKNWHPSGDHCFYLPYADPDYGEDRGTSRRFEMLSAKAPAVVFRDGSMTVNIRAPVTSKSFPLAQILPLNVPPEWAGQEITVEFDAHVPRLPKTNSRHWFYDGFMPELLDVCPKPGLDPVYYRGQIAAHYQGTIKYPSGWQYAGPGTLDGDQTIAIDQRSHELAFALGHDYQKKEFEAGGTHVTMLYQSPNFKELEATVSETLPVMVHLLGPFPFPSLTIVETSELQRHGLPGLIAMNRPAQAIFNKVQQSILNWEHWIFAIQLARQWYGGAIVAPSPDDEWLISGIVDFITLESLSRHPARFNLFSASDAGFRILSFDYLQIAEMSAALLRRSSPFSILTTSAYKTHDPVAEQYPLLFTKHTFAMRQLKGFAGEQPFFGFLRNLTANYLYKTLSPPQFHAFLQRLPSPFSPKVRGQLDTFLTRWWTLDGWPDFALLDATSERLPDGRWVSQLSAKQEGTIDFPPLFGVKDASEQTYISRGERPKGQLSGPWTASIVTPNEPIDEAVDPIHETFDADRFNNRLGWADWSFFPGGADTLRDDAYTVLWFPYAFRRPGEPFSLGIQSALFRYINSDLIARVEWAPGTNLGAVAISDSFQVPAYAMGISLGLSQNYDHDRLAEAIFSRSPVFKSFPNFSTDLVFRHRERAGEPETAHSTAGIALHLRPVGYTRTCGYNLGASYEKAPGALAAGFNYDRRFGLAVLDCNITNRSSASVRFFRGSVTGEGDLPQVALFKPTDLKEAHLRLSSVGTWAREIATTNLDLYLPFFLPLPDDSMVLARQMRWRLFYDLGRSWVPGLNYRSGGFGFLFPLGGDLSGAGSLAVTRLTLLVVAYNDIGGVVDKRPSLLLDISGDL